MRSAVFCGTTNEEILQLPEAIHFDDDEHGRQLHEAFQGFYTASAHEEAGVHQYKLCTPDAPPEWVDVPKSKTFWSPALRDTTFLPKADHIISTDHRTDARLMDMNIPVVIWDRKCIQTHAYASRKFLDIISKEGYDENWQYTQWLESSVVPYGHIVSAEVFKDGAERKRRCCQSINAPGTMKCHRP